jgi:hypothetical protein
MTPFFFLEFKFFLKKLPIFTSKTLIFYSKTLISPSKTPIFTCKNTPKHRFSPQKHRFSYQKTPKTGQNRLFRSFTLPEPKEKGAFPRSFRRFWSAEKEVKNNRKKEIFGDFEAIFGDFEWFWMLLGEIWDFLRLFLMPFFAFLFFFWRRILNIKNRSLNAYAFFSFYFFSPDDGF